METEWLEVVGRRSGSGDMVGFSILSGSPTCTTPPRRPPCPPQEQKRLAAIKSDLERDWHNKNQALRLDRKCLALGLPPIL